jgi:glycosyltransferase involved in cell wall biosynthesis
MQAPLVSIVMPSFNQAQFIAESMDSVLNQSYRQLELIVADGGSTDGTQAILASYQAKDARLRWLSEPDHGPADAINKALKRVRGTYIGWLNSDDLYTAGAVERAVAKLSNASKFLMVYGHGEHIDANGHFLEKYPTLEPQVGFKQFANGCFICQPTVFFQRSMIVLLGGLDSTLRTAFDFDWWLRAFSTFPDRIGFLDVVQAKSRLHDAGITRSMRRIITLECVILIKKYLDVNALNWVIYHLKESKYLETSNLENYLNEVIVEVECYFSSEENVFLRNLVTELIK